MAKIICGTISIGTGVTALILFAVAALCDFKREGWRCEDQTREQRCKWERRSLQFLQASMTCLMMCCAFFGGFVFNMEG